MYIGNYTSNFYIEIIWGELEMNRFVVCKTKLVFKKNLFNFWSEMKIHTYYYNFKIFSYHFFWSEYSGKTGVSLKYV